MEENYLAEDGFLHVASAQEVFYMGLQLREDESEDALRALEIIRDNPGNYEGVAFISFEKDDVVTSLVLLYDDNDPDNEKYYIVTVGRNSENYYVYSGNELDSGNVSDRKPTNCRSHNVVDMTPNAPPRWLQSLQTFAHNFWYCEYHL